MPSAVHESQLRTVQLAGQLHGVGSGNDRLERQGTRRRRSVEQTACQLQQEDVGEKVPRATPTHVSESSERRRAAVTQREETWKKMIMELEGGVKIPDEKRECMRCWECVLKM